MVCDAVVSGGLAPTFQSDLLPPSSEYFSFLKV